MVRLNSSVGLAAVQQNLKCLDTYRRAVAAGTVDPVSTGPLLREHLKILMDFWPSEVSDAILGYKNVATGHSAC